MTYFVKAHGCNDLDKEREHWQDLREHAAIAAMQGVMNFFGSLDYNREFIAKLAVEQADALVEELKKTNYDKRKESNGDSIKV